MGPREPTSLGDLYGMETGEDWGLEALAAASSTPGSVRFTFQGMSLLSGLLAVGFTPLQFLEL